MVKRDEYTLPGLLAALVMVFTAVFLMGVGGQMLGAALGRMF